MTIRRRFSLSFLGILAMFAINVGIYAWSNGKRSVAVNELRRAISRQVLLSSIQLTLHDTLKQVSLLTQVATEASAAGASASEKAQFNARLVTTRERAAQLRQLSGTDRSPTVSQFDSAVDQLCDSWRIFYDNFGVNQAKAIQEVAVRSDPLAQKVMEDLLPRLQSEENQRVDLASANFHQASRISDRVSYGIFVMSSMIAIFLAWLVSRDMNNGLAALKAGAAALGRGDLSYRISLNRKDEFGQLGAVFDEMAAHLSAARSDLTKTHKEEMRKSEELTHALDALKTAQDQLIVQQKLASLGTLTAGIAHEIKNPLNFVTNFSLISVDLVSEIRDLLRENRGRIEPKDYEYIEEILIDLQGNVRKIQEHGKRADGIVKGMLMHSRGQRGHVQPTNLNSLVAEYIKLAYHGMRAQDINFNITINEDYDSRIPMMDVVPHDLSRVILNIANNACYAANHKNAKNGQGFAPTLTVQTKDLDDRVEIRIRDNGDGIAPEIRQRIFEPFFTTKPTGSGTGLGLSMSYDIVAHEHKGELRVESEPGQYAEFIIALPKK